MLKTYQDRVQPATWLTWRLARETAICFGSGALPVISITFAAAFVRQSLVARVGAGAKARRFPSACYLVIQKSVKKTTRVKQKVIGRPRTGITPLMGFRADPLIRASIVRWAEKQPDRPTLSEAIRRLVELGLKVKK